MDKGGCCMVRYNLLPIIIMASAAIMLMFLSCHSALADDGSSGSQLYGFPMDIVLPQNSAIDIPGQGTSYNDVGYTLPDFGTTYGFEAFEESPILGGSSGYFGPDIGDQDLSTAFGMPVDNNVQSTTAFAQSLIYQANLDNTFIAFPGIGVGALGVSFPTISNQKSSVSYDENVQFQFSTDSNTLQVGGFGYPLGLGLGYSSAIVGTDPGAGVLNSTYGLL